MIAVCTPELNGDVLWAVPAARELANRVNTYAKLCAAAVPMSPPSGGDCWHCALVVVPAEKAEPVQSRMHCAKGEAPRVLPCLEYVRHQSA